MTAAGDAVSAFVIMSAKEGAIGLGFEFELVRPILTDALTSFDGDTEIVTFALLDELSTDYRGMPGARRSRTPTSSSWCFISTRCWRGYRRRAWGRPHAAVAAPGTPAGSTDRGCVPHPVQPRTG